MIFHENRLLADDSHVISYLILSKIGKDHARMKIPAWFPGGKGTNFCSTLRLYPVWIFTNIQYKRNFIFSNRSKEFQAYSQTKYLN